MPDEFDPYLKWLGVRDAARPPNHYRLLGLEPFESDAEVISNAADRQMAHVRTFQTGEHSALSQRILNELAAARLCLLNRAQRAAYDSQLRGEAAATLRSFQPGGRQSTAGAEHESLAAEVVSRKRPTKRWRLVAGSLMALGLLAAAVIFQFVHGRDATNAGRDRRIPPSSDFVTKARIPPSGSGAAQAPPSSSTTVDLDEPSPTTKPDAATASVPDEPPPPSSSVAPPDESQEAAPSEDQSAQSAPSNAPDPADPAIQSPDEQPAAAAPSSLPIAGEERTVEGLPAAEPLAAVPSEDELAKARLRVRAELYPQQLAAARTDAERLALSDTMRKAALEATLTSATDAADLAALRCALLHEAAELAIDAGDIEHAWMAVDVMARQFEVDERSLKDVALRRIARSVRGADQHRDVALAALDLAEQARMDDSRLSKSLVELAKRAARRSGDEDLIERTGDPNRVARPRRMPPELVLSLGGKTTLVFRLIRAGKFMAGEADEPREITIATSFYLATTEVTQGQWASIMGQNPSYYAFKNDPLLPVDSVSWHDCQRYIEALSRAAAGKGRRLRLPTSAEWEYACRAGSTAVYSFGDDARGLARHAWFRPENSDQKSHPVGQLAPNAWGLYDMHGNVAEWCGELVSETGELLRLGPGQETPATAQAQLRGGSYRHRADNCRATSVHFDRPDARDFRYGFRLVCEP